MAINVQRARVDKVQVTMVSRCQTYIRFMNRRVLDRAASDQELSNIGQHAHHTAYAFHRCISTFHGQEGFGRTFEAGKHACSFDVEQTDIIVTAACPTCALVPYTVTRLAQIPPDAILT